MSRIGSKPITIPSGITVKIENSTVTVSNGKESLSTNVPSEVISVVQEDQEIIVKRSDDTKESRSLHGLIRSLINNNIIGLTEGFKKNLEINGVGYKAAKQGSTLVLNLGYSHQIEVEEPKGITIDVPAPNRITVSGADKQLVGETAAVIRGYRTPDPYKGKGIKYDYEQLHLKEGKTGAK
ncbi:MAG: 50S ribosomal protein L6 [Fastidiosipilaceae bacterium]|jgi:large subunit ribosomal protein L6|nr:50S ribosomal protein L6 [Clostridiaceae bacterium]